VALVVLAAAGTGCGGSDKSTSDQQGPLTADEKAARDVFEQYLQAVTKPDYKRACSLLTKASRKQLSDLGKRLAKTQRKKLSRVAIARLRSGCAGTFETINGPAGSSQLANARRRAENLKVVSVRVRGARALITTNQAQRKAAMQRVGGKWQVSQ
jgi:hypothetical protein